MYSKKASGWRKHFDFILLDIFILELSFVFAYYFRYGVWNPFEKRIGINIAFCILFSAVFVSVFLDVHKDILKRGYLKELKQVLITTFTSSVFIIVYLFITKQSSDSSRLSIIFYLIVSTVLLEIARSIWKLWLTNYQLKMDRNVRRFLLVTTGDLARNTIVQLRNLSYGGIDVSGLILMDNSMEVGSMLSDVEVVASYDDAIPFMQKNWVDEVMIQLSPSMEVPNDFLDSCALMGITVHIGIPVSGDRQVMSTVEKVAGYTVITESLRIVPDNKVAIKRLFDIIGAIVGLFFTGIILIFVGPIIYFSDPGPIFFSQIRVGENGRKFRLYKLRSMYQDAEARKKELMDKNEMQGLMFKMENDPRIIGSGPDGTRHGIGWFIRKTSLDEFPQFWNVLIGDMSLVGTRPPTVEEYEQYDLHHKARLSFKPGITGLWQVSGRSDITDFEEVVALDMQYINNWSFGEDIKILFRTVFQVLGGSGAK